MGWSAPATYATNQLITAADLNLIRDNLNYLKGNAGAVLIASTLQATALGVNVAPSASYIAYLSSILPVRIEQSSSGIDYLDLNNTAAAGNRWAIRMRDLAEGDFGIRDVTAGVYRQYFNAAGFCGFGTTSPQGKIHAVGAGGGFVFVSCNAVDGTLQTPVAAGTVTQSAAFWAYDRNNTGGGVVQVSGNMLTLGQTFPFANTDTVTVTLTAGGAITVQRTAGTNATHQVNALILYK